MSALPLFLALISPCVTAEAPVFNCYSMDPETAVRVRVEYWFEPEDVATAMDIAWCESRYDPNAKNPTSTASGIFQQLKAWWTGKWGTFGPFDPFDIDVNIEHAAYLRRNNGWRDWYSSRWCWQ